MNWKRLWTRKPKVPTSLYVKGMGNDNYAAIPVRLIFPDAPLKMDHTVIHTPYPKPTVITLTFYDNEGRQWVMPPYQCRGAPFYMMNVPPQLDGQRWVRVEMKMYYD